MIVDKDSGRVYDMRNERHVERLTESEINMMQASEHLEKSIKNPKTGKKKSAWNGWWE